MCERLGIKIIAAGSPQAKGRVERSHGTYQDRMVKKMRRKKIATHAAANQYLEKEYCDAHNQRFVVDAASEVDYHLPAPGAKQRREIFRLETERTLSNDWVVRHENRFYQVESQSRSYAPAKSKVIVCEWEDGAMEIHYRGQKLSWHEIQERPKKAEAVTVQPKLSTPPVPQANHPWRRSYQDMQPPMRTQVAGAVAFRSADSASASP